MAVPMKLSGNLVERAKQIEHWFHMGKAILENPDMPLRMIQDTLLSLEEVKAGQVVPYQFG